MSARPFERGCMASFSARLLLAKGITPTVMTSAKSKVAETKKIIHNFMENYKIYYFGTQ
jgi:hypothetical protein